MMLLEKRKICHGFNTAVKTYDEAADWQKTVGKILLNELKNYDLKNKTILDLGAGTGYLSRCIQKQYPDNHLLVVDMVESMLILSQLHLQNASLICADVENMPLKSESIEIIISNMVLHWCASLKSALREQYRILKSNGMLIFSILGEQSMVALKNAWSKIDDNTHVNIFPTLNIVKSSCLSSGFSIALLNRQIIKKNYDDVFELMYHLKRVGSKNISANKPRSLMNKQRIKKLNEYYQNPLCYDVITVVCQK